MSPKKSKKKKERRLAEDGQSAVSRTERTGSGKETVLGKKATAKREFTDLGTEIANSTK